MHLEASNLHVLLYKTYQFRGTAAGSKCTNQQREERSARDQQSLQGSSSKVNLYQTHSKRYRSGAYLQIQHDRRGLSALLRLALQGKSCDNVQSRLRIRRVRRRRRERRRERAAP